MVEVPQEPDVIQFGTFAADLASGELFKSGRKVKLQEQPFQVLAALLRSRGEVVTREELQKLVWPADTFVDFDHGLNRAVSKVRDVLDDSAETPRFIETVPRRGYVLSHLSRLRTFALSRSRNRNCFQSRGSRCV